MEYESQPSVPHLIEKYCSLLHAYYPNTRLRRQVLSAMQRKLSEYRPHQHWLGRLFAAG
jgi:hypothetical protein